ncbi:hypothetical protein OJ996_15480 [Luteolibacter sp. GHJ8]|uniref:Uncharacterized protein n=1 Tax=Luteolibacter rhizosphaerae TaxID=2989719 RepID=A0ABT3G552_9BACT|nr:hypothetical protein [Luteolibacter rhizosphaerae]MCW1914989.1 hypothetical protein [Luteolibacter rhizosphaerae]
MEAAVKWNESAIEFGFHGLDHFCTVKFAEMEKASQSPKLVLLLDAFESDHRPNWSSQYYGKRWKPFRKRLHEIEENLISGMDEAFWRMAGRLAQNREAGPRDLQPAARRHPVALRTSRGQEGPSAESP